MYGGDTRHSNNVPGPARHAWVVGAAYTTWEYLASTRSPVSASSSRITPSRHLDTITITFHSALAGPSSSHPMKALTGLATCCVMTNKYRITIALWNNLWIITAFYWDKKELCPWEIPKSFFIPNIPASVTVSGIYGLRKEKRERDGRLISWVLSNSGSPGGGNVCFNSDVGDSPGSELSSRAPAWTSLGSCKQTRGTWDHLQRVTQEIQNTGVRYCTNVVWAQHGGWDGSSLDILAFLAFYPPSLWVPGCQPWLMVKVVPEPRAMPEPEFEGYPPSRRARPQQTVTLCYSRPGRASYSLFQQFIHDFFSLCSAWQNCSQNSCEEKLRHG